MMDDPRDATSIASTFTMAANVEADPGWSRREGCIASRSRRRESRSVVVVDDDCMGRDDDDDDEMPRADLAMRRLLHSRLLFVLWRFIVSFVLDGVRGGG
jgi:hypothetical protein